MPTYQYACTSCDHEFEQFQRFTEDSLTTCPRCQGRLRKVFNAVGVVFKGSGFYRTDSRASANGSEKSSESTSNGDGESGKTESGAGSSTGSGAGSGSSSSDGSSSKDSSKTGAKVTSKAAAGAA